MLGFNELSSNMLRSWGESSLNIVLKINENFNILECNKVFEPFLEQFPNILDIITLTHRSDFMDKFRDSQRTKNVVKFRSHLCFDPLNPEDIPYSYDVFMEYKSADEIFLVLEPIAPLSHEQAISYFTMVNDFSYLLRKLKKYEIKLKKKNEELQKSHKKEKLFLKKAKMIALSELVGNIAHQWRQPLNIISATAGNVALKAQLDNLSMEEIESSMDIIINDTQYLSEIINTFKDFADPNKQKQEVILQERIDLAVNFIKETLNNNNIKLIDNINKDEQIILSLVIGELYRAIINIIDNAKDVLIDKKISQPWIKLDMELKKEKVIISIEDNAGGIDEDIITRIYEPYFTTKHQSLGIGLGLYTTYKSITEILKGDIMVENTQNGAKFYIELPLS